MDHYKILGVSINATEEQIKAAYLKKATECHPDKNLNDPEGAAEKFKRVQEAFEALSDPGKRAAYNRNKPKPKPKPRKPQKKPTKKQQEANKKKRYPHNDTIYDVNIKPPKNLTGANDDLSTVDLWKQAGLEEWEPPNRMPHVRSKYKRKSAFIDP
jgi:curved DNA-binding protein CbpA